MSLSENAASENGAATENSAAVDQLEPLSRTLEQLADRVLTDGAAPAEESLRRIVTAAARLHAGYTETRGTVDPLRPDVSPTEAVDLACGLLRSRDLNPFDLALWFSHSG